MSHRECLLAQSHLSVLAVPRGLDRQPRQVGQLLPLVPYHRVALQRLSVRVAL
jgi:hypothetical protein